MYNFLCSDSLLYTCTSFFFFLLYMVFIHVIVHGVQFVKEGIISLDVRTEWKTYRQLLSKQPKDNLKTQLHELATNDIYLNSIATKPTQACLLLFVTPYQHSIS